MKTLNDFKEKLILKKALAGKKEAFSEIYDFYVVRIFRFIYLKTSSRETAEDLASEVFLRYWKRIKKGMKDKRLSESIANDKIKPFLYKISRNLIIDFYRKKEVLTVEINEEIKEKIKDQGKDILAEISAKQEVEEMMKALHKIKGEYREVIILRYIEELSITEVAEIMGKSGDSVRVLSHRAIKSLKRVVK
ncbi:MAG: RNA polymerase sigma factor [Candidatus Pacebacteria bacterium]|nr:RNA polymerase sigma factor [Candidatus Paceibacterota bacterium]